jgi:DNA-binding NarL/FixJ family response regulator
MSNQKRGSRVRVLVSGPDRMACDLLANSLSKREFEIVAGATTHAEVVAAVRRGTPQISIISEDFADEPRGGFSTLSEIRKIAPSVLPVMLLRCRTRDTVLDAFRGGARGILYRADSFRSISKCLAAVYEGQVWAGTLELQYLVDAFSRVSPLRILRSKPDAILTHREIQVVALVADGLSNRNISIELALSEHTVKNYLYKIFDKTGVSTRAELMVYAAHRKPHSGLNAFRASA